MTRVISLCLTRRAVFPKHKNASKQEETEKLGILGRKIDMKGESVDTPGIEHGRLGTPGVLPNKLTGRNKKHKKKKKKK